jgi:SET domain-containing protein
MPTLSVRGTDDKGRAVYADEAIPAGADVLAFKGEVLHRSDVPSPLRPEEDHYIQIGRSLYLGPSGEMDDLVNHSCDPNCWVRIQGIRAVLVALRPIAPGEEITYDYATTSTEEPQNWTLTCLCGSPQCRGKVTGFPYTSVAVQDAYLAKKIIPGYVAEAAFTTM